jgi:cysteine-rich repeat protein
MDLHRGNVALCIAGLLSACLQPASGTCADLLCPVGTVCAAEAQRCVAPAQLYACTGRLERDACSMPGAAAARCVSGVCVSVVCGDGVVQGDEVCDDGNTRSCDGCSSDCRSDESCGNQIVDCNEQCDEGAGNSSAPNASCRPGCMRAACGDGVVDDQLGEDCDGAPSMSATCAEFGFYGGALGCSAGCRNDTSACAGTCGDGVVNGAELCDGAPPAGQSCLDYGYDIGNLGCAALCTPSFARCERMGFAPMPFSSSAYFYWVWGSGPGDVFAVGYAGDLLHFDGGAWSPMDSGTGHTLWTIWGTGPRDVFAAGSSGTIVHYDGTAFTPMTSPVENALYGMWGSGPRDVFAVGSDGTVVHYDGTAWSLLDSGTEEKLVDRLGQRPGRHLRRRPRGHDRPLRRPLLVGDALGHHPRAPGPHRHRAGGRLRHRRLRRHPALRRPRLGGAAVGRLPVPLRRLGRRGR